MGTRARAPLTEDATPKERRRAWKRGRRRATRPFKGLSVLTGTVLVLLVIAFVLATTFEPTVNLLLNTSSERLVNEDAEAVYHESEYASDEERLAAGATLTEELEAGGAVLLKNDGDALPLARGAKVTAFSHSSVDLVYGGTGSGNIDTETAANLKGALTEAGLEVNPTMWDFYESGAGSEYARARLSIRSGSSHTINEVPWDAYTEEALGSVSEYGDAAIVVISRVGGEGQDLPSQTGEDAKDGNYLQLNETEEELLSQLARMKGEGAIKKIVVLINSSNAIEVDFLSEEAYGIDAALWIGGVGQHGVNAVADILVGDVNPSGRLADTYCNDNLTSPAMTNMGTQTYANAEEMGAGKYQDTYTVYQEGIYVGYRYYETRYEDYVMGTAGAGSYDYAADVAYPFGYGLSYTTFAYSDLQARYDAEKDAYEVSVTVTNTGDVAGRHVVEVWAQTPYTAYDQENGIEKSAVQLVGFTKTKLLQPGESVTETLTVDRYDLASYDAQGAQGYVIDAGTHYLTVASDAHEAANNILAAKGHTPESTDGRMDGEGAPELTWAWEEPELDATSYATSAATGAEVTNQFDDADPNRCETTGDQSVTYVSRANWEATLPSAPVSLELTDEMMAELAYQNYDPATYEGAYADAEMPTTGADNGISLYDMRDLAFDDPLWEDFLDQLTVEEMAEFCGRAFHFTQPIESCEIPGTRDENGPQGLTTSLFGKSAKATGFTSEDVMAATWDVELVARVGACIGEDCLSAGVDGLYGPGANIHRTPYAGRNFEYYSEDAHLSAQMAAAEVSGIQSKGVFVFMKHFALNDFEDDREGINVWANEQSIREIYLRAFEDAFTEAGASGVMTSYTCVGHDWSGSYEGLIAGVLRGEWDCQGLVISDNTNSNNAYMNAADAVLAGSDIFDGMMSGPSDTLREHADDPAVVSAMRDAVHRSAYTIAHSAAMNGIGPDTRIEIVQPGWKVALEVALVVAAVAFATCTVVAARRSRAWSAEHPKPSKRA